MKVCYFAYAYLMATPSSIILTGRSLRNKIGKSLIKKSWIEAQVF